jgi:hypothetical protein
VQCEQIFDLILGPIKLNQSSLDLVWFENFSLVISGIFKLFGTFSMEMLANSDNVSLNHKAHFKRVSESRQ